MKLHRLTLILTCLLSLLFSITTFVFAQESEEGGAPEYPEEPLEIIEPEPEYVASIAWSPDGTKIAVGAGAAQCNYIGNDYSIRVLDASNGDLLIRVGAVNHCTIHNLDWSPDSAFIVGNGLAEIAHIWDVATGYTTGSFLPHSRSPLGFTQNLWNNSGDKIASIQALVADVVIWNPDSSEELLSFPAYYPQSLDWSPDGSQIVTASSTLHVWDSSTSTLVRTLINAPGMITDITWSSDGTRLAGITQQHEIHIWNAVTGEQEHVLTTSAEVYAIRWRPNAQALASVYDDGTVYIWDVVSGEPIAIYQCSQPVYAVDWSPDGRRLVYGGEIVDGSPLVQIVDVADEIERDSS